ncbi:MAG TPA: bifunctional oligoribonuclease/PAP phosphatase NrnA [Thermodesulfobacteriota bacterium]
MNDLEKIISVISVGKRFLITSHENPDGDAIGSMLALGLALEHLGKEIVYYNNDGVPLLLRFLPYAEKVISSLDDIDGDFSATFIVDCTDASRVGEKFVDFKKRGRCGVAIIIDHHKTSKPSADLYILNPKASSTGMIIYSLLKTLSLQITPEIGKNLYTSILVDTGSFRYSNTIPEAFEIAGELVELGVKPWEISQALYESEPLGKIKLLGYVLPTLEITDDGHIASVVVKNDMFKATGTSKEDTEGFVNFPRSINGVEVAVLFREEEPSEDVLRWKISLRSKGRVNVAQIGEKFGGGGHERAAGCLIYGTLPEVKQMVFGAIKEEL